MAEGLSEATQGPAGMLWNVGIGAASASAGKMKESTVVFFQEEKWKDVPKTAWIMTAGTIGLFAAGVWSRSPAFLTLNVITGACVIFTIRQVPWTNLLQEYKGVKVDFAAEVEHLQEQAAAHAAVNQERLEILINNEKLVKTAAERMGTTTDELKAELRTLIAAAERHEAANATQEQLNAQMQQMTRMPELLAALRELLAKVDAQDAAAQRAQSLISSIPVSVAVA